MSVYPNLPDKFVTRMLAIQLAAAAGAEGGGGGWLKGAPYSVEEKKLLSKFLGLEGDGAEGGGGGSVNPFSGVGVGQGVGVDGDGDGDGDRDGDRDGGVIVKDLDRFDVLLNEVEVTIGEMRDLEREMRGTDDPSDRIAVIRAKTVLLEKWANLKSSVWSMREMAEFQQAVLEVLDKVMTVDQRGEFMSRIKQLKN